MRHPQLCLTLLILDKDQLHLVFLIPHQFTLPTYTRKH